MDICFTQWSEKMAAILSGIWNDTEKTIKIVQKEEQLWQI